jgi:squalene synthase HpnC
MERAMGENFPVALRVLPAAARRHLLAIYGFARLCDELGDTADGERLVLLDELQAELGRAYEGRASHPLLQRLTPTLVELSLPRQPFLDLIEANRQDQRVSRYQSWKQLEGYCALSANPVGRLVLCVFGVDTAGRRVLSDSVCTALQLVEHCQDVAEDFAHGRVYLPAEDQARFGCSESDLAAPTAAASLRALLRFEVERVREQLEAGIPLVASLRGAACLAVAGFVAGGYAAADSLERCDYDVLFHAPRTRRRDLLRHLLRVLWRARGPQPRKLQ